MFIGNSRKKKNLILKLEIPMLKFNFILNCLKHLSLYKGEIDIITEER